MNELSVSNDDLIALLGAKEAELFALRKELRRLQALLIQANLEIEQNEQRQKEAHNGYQPSDAYSGLEETISNG